MNGSPDTPRRQAPPLPLTHPDGFADAVDALPEALRARVAPLKPHVAPPGDAGPVRAVYVAVRLALDAWQRGDEFAALSLAEQAVTAASAAPPKTPPAAPDGAPEAEFGAAPAAAPIITPSGPWPRFPAPAAWPARNHVHLHSGARGLPLDGAVYAATDASWNARRGDEGYGYGYIVTTGLWGVRGGALVPEQVVREQRVARGEDTDGHPDTSTLHELRAIGLLLEVLADHLPPGTPVRLLCDNTAAQRYLRQWQSTEASRYPSGEQLLIPRDGRYTGVRPLARLVRSLPHLTVLDVQGHSGHLLNEAADSLAKMARRYTQGRDNNIISRGTELTESFLRSWAQGGEDRTGGHRTAGHHFPGNAPTRKAI